MIKLGLIGGSAISKYSIAPALWQSMVKLPLEYSVFDVRSAKEISKIINDRSFLGFNVAKPYKKYVCGLATPDDDTTRILGICNTIYRKDHELCCANTDGDGCLDGMKLSGFKVTGSKTLIIGCGGAGASLAFALIKNGGSVWIFDHNDQKISEFVNALGRSRSKLHIWNERKTRFDAIVNATPAGMKIMGTSNHLKTPLSKSHLDKLQVSFFVEMNYNPYKTVFLRIGEKNGAIIVPGFYMSYFQALRAAEKFCLGFDVRYFGEVLKRCSIYRK